MGGNEPILSTFWALASTTAQKSRECAYKCSCSGNKKKNSCERFSDGPEG